MRNPIADEFKDFKRYVLDKIWGRLKPWFDKLLKIIPKPFLNALGAILTAGAILITGKTFNDRRHDKNLIKEIKKDTDKAIRDSEIKKDKPKKIVCNMEQAKTLKKIIDAKNKIDIDMEKNTVGRARNGIKYGMTRDKDGNILFFFNKSRMDVMPGLVQAAALNLCKEKEKSVAKCAEEALEAEGKMKYLDYINACKGNKEKENEIATYNKTLDELKQEQGLYKNKDGKTRDCKVNITVEEFMHNKGSILNNGFDYKYNSGMVEISYEYEKSEEIKKLFGDETYFFSAGLSNLEEGECNMALKISGKENMEKLLASFKNETEKDKSVSKFKIIQDGQDKDTYHLYANKNELEAKLPDMKFLYEKNKAKENEKEENELEIKPLKFEDSVIIVQDAMDIEDGLYGELK